MASRATSPKGGELIGTDRWKGTNEGSKASSKESSTKGSAVVSRQPSFNSILSSASPSLNLSDPSYTSSKIGDTFTHYARKRYEIDRKTLTRSSSKADDDRPDKSSDEETIDRKALGQLATDCVLSFLYVLRRENAAKWKDEKAKR